MSLSATVGGVATPERVGRGTAGRIAVVFGDGALAEVAGEAMIGLGASSLVRSSVDGLDDVLREARAVGIVDLRRFDPRVIGDLDRCRPDVPVVAIVPAGQTGLAADAVKRGAADVAEWPVPATRLREIVRRLFEQEGGGEEPAYAERVEAARRSIRAHALGPAEAQLRRALTIEVLRPEALNLLGVIARARGALRAAQVWWRMALDVDPAYAPARDNLLRATRRPPPTGPLRLD